MFKMHPEFLKFLAISIYIPFISGQVQRYPNSFILSVPSSSFQVLESKSLKSLSQPSWSLNKDEDNQESLKDVSVPSKTMYKSIVISNVEQITRNSHEASESLEKTKNIEDNVEIESMNVMCGKKAMKVQATFTKVFNGTIYALGHWNEPKCHYVKEKSGQKVYEFIVRIDECGVSYMDDGLYSGGHSSVKGDLVTSMKSDVLQPTDAMHRIECLWQGKMSMKVATNGSVHVVFPPNRISEYMFKGDTATVKFEIQNGKGPKAPEIEQDEQVPFGSILTAVATVQKDSEFDILVHDCVASDTTNKGHTILLTDKEGCPVNTKLMGGWKKFNKDSGSYLPGQGSIAYAYISAFGFPGADDLMIECTVTLCKGGCDSCPEFTELEAFQSEIVTRRKRQVKEFDYKNNSTQNFKLSKIIHLGNLKKEPKEISSTFLIQGFFSQNINLISLVIFVISILTLIFVWFLLFIVYNERRQKLKKLMTYTF